MSKRYFARNEEDSGSDSESENDPSSVSNREGGDVNHAPSLATDFDVDYRMFKPVGASNKQRDREESDVSTQSVQHNSNKSDAKLDATVSHSNSESERVSSAGDQSEDDSDESDDSYGDDDSESESESEEEPAPRPIFKSRLQRSSGDKIPLPNVDKDVVLNNIEQARLREQLDAKKLGFSQDLMAVDDTDGLDPEGEYDAWKIRERARLTRDRAILEQKEREAEEKFKLDQLSEKEKNFLALKRTRVQRQKRPQQTNKVGVHAFDSKSERERKLLERNYNQALEDLLQDQKAVPLSLQHKMVGQKGQLFHKSLKEQDTSRQDHVG